MHKIGGVREKVDRLSLPRLKGGEGGARQEQDGVTAGEAPWVNCAASPFLRRTRKSVSDRSEKLICSPPASLQGDTSQCACVCVSVCAGACIRVAFHVSRLYSCRAADGGRSSCRRAAHSDLPTHPPRWRTNPTLKGCG